MWKVLSYLQKFLVAFALFACVAADVSHLSNEYLPPLQNSYAAPSVSYSAPSVDVGTQYASNGGYVYRK